MKKNQAPLILIIAFAFLCIASSALLANGTPTDKVSSKTRCTVCGMFVAKYPNWLAQIHYADLEQTRFFDGVKDMMVFYFSPEKFDGPPQASIRELYVKDYYSLSWLPAKEAYFIIGSDIYGPMGHELIPFGSREAAESFQKDHNGKEILTFNEITPETIDSLRAGQRMR